MSSLGGRLSSEGMLHLPMAVAPSPLNSTNDLLLITSMLKLLDRKKSLITYLKQMNEIAEKIKDTLPESLACDQNALSTVVSKNFQNRYAWVVVQLEKTSQSLQAGLVDVRRRRQEMTTISQLPPTPLPLPPQWLPDSSATVTSLCLDNAQKFISKNRAKMITDGRLPPFSPVVAHRADSFNDMRSIAELLKNSVGLVLLLRVAGTQGQTPLGELDRVLKAMAPQKTGNSASEAYYQDILRDVQILRKINQTK
jgi:hypothetical protein